MANPTGSSQIDLADTQPAPNSLSDTPPNGYDATIGERAATILAEIEANNTPNTPTDALRRLCIVFGCAGVVLVVVWGIIELTPAKRWVDNRITSYNVARQDCLEAREGGKGLNQIYLPALNGWCTGISEVSWWKLSSLHNTRSIGDDYGRRMP